MLKEDLNIIMVDTHDPKTIAFGDISNYGSTIINNPSFEITPPGFNKLNVLFTPQSVNIFSSTDLKLGCEYDYGLPDGIYRIKYSIKPNTQLFIEKSFMNVSSILCNFYKFVLTLPEDKVIDIKLLIDGAVSAANLGDCTLSQELYTQAQKLIERADKNCC